MTSEKRVLGLITARGGSKGLPQKNLRALAGKPLLTWTIEAAQRAAKISKLILSTDSPAIADLARQTKCDVPFMRPSDLATDAATSVDVAIHAIENCPGYEYLCLLQPTSPLRTAEDIDQCLELLMQTQAPSVISFCESNKPLDWFFRLGAQNRIEPIASGPISSQRQSAPKIYYPNGAVYAVSIEALKRERRFYFPETRAYLMPKERSVDIDDIVDFRLAGALLEQ